MKPVLDQPRSFAITWRQCGSSDLQALRHWNTPPSGKVFDPTHHCNKCGQDFIWHSPKERLRDYI